VADWVTPSLDKVTDKLDDAIMGNPGQWESKVREIVETSPEQLRPRITGVFAQFAKPISTSAHPSVSALPPSVRSFFEKYSQLSFDGQTQILDALAVRTVTTQMGKHSITQTVWGKPCKIPDIRFVGLFDTVGSFGVPGNQVNVGYNLGLPPNFKVARQAVGADEQRYLFPLTPLGSGGDGQDFEEVYFPSDHSDIGRGHERDTRDMSFAPYYYIWSEGRAAGVPFGPLRDFTFTGNTTPHDLSSGFPYTIFPKRPR